MKTIFRCFLILGFITAGFALSVFGQIQDWPMVNGNREHTSWAHQEEILKPPLIETGILKVDGIEEPKYTDITWFDHTLCVAIKNEGENLFAMFDTNTGDTLWTFRVPLSGGSVDFSAAQNDSMVICGGQHGSGLFALDRLTGQQKWFRPSMNLFCKSPVIDGDRIYIVDDQMKCLDIADGEIIWEVPQDGWVSPAVDETHCYVCGGYQTVCYNKGDGTKIWDWYNSNRSYMVPVLYDDYLYTHTHDSLVAYEKSTGAVHWVYQASNCNIPGLSQGAIAVSDSAICCAIWENQDGKGELLTLNRLDGTYRWHTDFTGPGVFTPMIANEVVYVTTYLDSVFCGFDLKTGAPLFCDGTHDHNAQPVVANHRLYVGTDYEGVVIFENQETHVCRDEHLPASFRLFQNFPNPFNPKTVISYQLTVNSFVELKIYDLLGKEVAVLVHDRKAPGEYALEWDGKDFPSGVYYCTMEAGEFTRVMKMVLLK